MSACFRLMAVFGALLTAAALTYGLAALGEPSSVWLWQLAGAL
ncbi:hypothetical protein [Aurantimonas sp. 22II-16-19i]|nr:hypothetical protein [Aurantimonas sp. 22II-16-19i]